MNEDTTRAAVPPPGGSEVRQPLDEVMLAMDIVDTIRRRERLVQRELDAEGREVDLRERLRKIYAAQGIDVPDHVLEQGVAAIKEDRFVYKPAAQGFQRKLAVLYVTRNRWGKWLLGAVAAVMVAAGGYYAAVVAPAAKLPGRIEAVHAEVRAIAATAEARSEADQIRDAGLAATRAGNADEARTAIASLEALHTRLEELNTLQRVEGRRIEGLHADVRAIAANAEARSEADQIRDAGLAATRAGNAAKARAAIASLEELLALLEQEYTLRVVNRPGEYSGVFRIPDVNEQARNYYVIVEAIDSRGNVLTLPILDEETGATKRVKAWGLRVDEHVFNAVANDKKDDGIIQNNQFGAKKRGRLVPDYTMPTTGAAITTW